MKSAWFHKHFSILVLLVIPFLSGCFSFSTMHTARPIKKGTSELTAAPLVVGLVAPEVTTENNEGEVKRSNSSIVVPTGELQFRHGVNDRFDLGIKLFLVGLGADFNVLLVDTHYLAMSVDPGFSAMYFGLGDARLFIGSLWLPVLFDVLTTKYVTLTMGPKVGMLFAVASSGKIEDQDGNTEVYSGNTVDGMVGGMTGLKIRITDSFSIMPEFNGVWEFNSEYFWWTAILSLTLRI